MKKLFIIHGFNSSSDRNWFPWLKKELKKYNIDFYFLSMPTPRYPIQDEWVETIKKNIEFPTEKVFLIGHSLGASAVLRYLETLQNDKKIGGAILVSCPINNIYGPGDRYDLLNKFLENSFNFNHIKNVCKKIAVIHGIDDPVVPFHNAEELSSKLSCELISIPDGKHLNDKAGFVELPEVLDTLIKIMEISHC